MSCTQTVISVRINHEIQLNLLKETVFTGKALPPSSRPTICANVQDPLKEIHLEKIRLCGTGAVDCTDLKLPTTLHSLENELQHP